MADAGTTGDVPIVTPARPRRRAVWPAFVAFGALIGLYVVSQVVAGLVVAVGYLATGGSVARLDADLPEVFASPPVFAGVLLSGQFTLLATIVIASRVSPVVPRGGLGWSRPGLTVWRYLVLVVGSFVPFALGYVVAAAVALLVPPSDELDQTVGKLTPGWAVPFVAMMALVPGVVEETVFRGYLQRRLAARWPAWAAILTASAMFAVLHLDPFLVAFAFVLGLWLGVVTWRAGSVRPAVVCHAAVNATSVGVNVGEQFGILPDDPPIAWLAVGGLVVLACFAASVRWLAREPVARATGDWTGERTPEAEKGAGRFDPSDGKP